jgi:hypothetical protein
MKMHDIRKTLNILREVKPDPRFTERSRALIMASARKPAAEGASAQLMGASPVASYLVSLMRIGSFVTASAVIVVALYYATQELSPFFLPGLNPGKITAEAEMINSNINIELSQIQQFSQTAEESSSILHEVNQKNLNHLNDTILNKETNNINQTLPIASPSTVDSVNGQIDSLLQELNK